MKPQRRKPRANKARDVQPPEVKEVSETRVSPPPGPEPDPIPEHIRRMLEAAYT